MVQFTYNLRRFGKKRFEEHLRLRRGCAVGTPRAWDRRRSGRPLRCLLRSAVTGAVRAKKTSGIAPDVFFVIMPETCFRFVLVPACPGRRPSGLLRTGRGGSCGMLGCRRHFSGSEVVRRRDVVLASARVEHHVDADAGQTHRIRGPATQSILISGSTFGERRSHRSGCG